MPSQVERRKAPVRDILRAHTRRLHEGLHRHTSFEGLLDGSLSLEGYRRLVRRLYGFYAPLEQAIREEVSDQAAASSGYIHVSRSDLLAQDMLDLAYTADEVAGASRCPRAIGLVTPASFGGVLYVIEGATLGGSQIDGAARDLLCHESPAGRRYWSWCRTTCKDRWKMANACLDQCVAEGVAISDLKKGAADTFEVFADWLAPLDLAPLAAEPGRAGHV